MHIVIPDDYQDAVRTLDCFGKLAGHDVTIYNDTRKSIEALAERFKDADALVLIRERTAITEALLKRLPKLKMISQTGRGVPHIDLDACTRHGVAVAVGGGSPYAPAELTWALIMASTRQLLTDVIAMKRGDWQTTFGVGLRGRTLGIFGYGKIGNIVANYGKAFGMNVLVWGREGSLHRAAADGFEAAANQRDLFARSDVLSAHIKLSPETNGIVTRDDLGAMKRTAHFINTSRAELVAHGALEAALSAGRPGFAAVDVYESEPVNDHPLLHMDNVICTPHLGYVERDSYELYFSSAFDNLLAYLDGQPVELLNEDMRK
jgi:D-3-phosphoglycerate dehydrogenase / 2-oxoglutarate reductase